MGIGGPRDCRQYWINLNTKSITAGSYGHAGGREWLARLICIVRADIGLIYKFQPAQGGLGD